MKQDIKVSCNCVASFTIGGFIPKELDSIIKFYDEDFETKILTELSPPPVEKMKLRKKDKKTGEAKKELSDSDENEVFFEIN